MENLIQASNQQIKCDLVIKNVNIVDVFQGTTFIGDVGIKNGIIVGIGNYDGLEIIDGTNQYICPSFIDAHMHIESTLVPPKSFYPQALLHGVTAVIADPHEIANVLGTQGIEFMLENSNDLPFDFYYMLPSCVPATPFESSGATLNAKELEEFYKDSNVLGLAEVMNYPGIELLDQDLLQKIKDAKSQRLTIDGHGAGFTTEQLNVYTTVGIHTDHECCTGDEALKRIQRGMYVLIRNGSVAKNLDDIISIVTPTNSRRFCFCTDDLHIDDLLQNGSIDQSIRIAIKHGIKPEIAIQMATLNTYECYNIKNKGAIAPGYSADFLLINDLEHLTIQQVFKDGKCLIKDQVFMENSPNNELDFPINSIHLPIINTDTFSIDLKDKTKLHVMEIIPNQIETNHVIYEIHNQEYFETNKELDLLKIAVIERHHSTNNIGLGIIKGLQLQSGAVATTIAHDSHNLIVTGTNDEDMIFAIHELEKLGGGIIVVENQKVIASMQLEIAGLMTNRLIPDVLEDLKQLHRAILELAPTLTFNPFLTLSFMALPVIPKLKITDKGLFNVETFTFINTAE